jgi:hypothetical protein
MRGEPLTPSGTSPIPNGDFESGNSVWTSVSNHDLLLYPLIVHAGELPSGVTPQSGSWAVWLGGFQSDTSSIEQSVMVPAISPKLTAWYWIASEETVCSFDRLSVTVNSVPIDNRDLCGSTSTGGWNPRTVDLSPWAGQTATLRLQVTTDSTLNSNVFIDTLHFDFELDPVFDDGFED